MANLQIHSKLPGVGTTIFTVMSSLAAELNAVNLGQGYPDFPMSEELTGLVTDAMRKGHNQYVHMSGLMSLRESLAAKIWSLYNAKVDPGTEITVTPGGTYAIYTSVTAVLQPGDEVIVFEPAYDSYIPNVEINGAKPVLIPLTYPGYRYDWDLVRKKINSRTRMIMLNSPHNPTGSILKKEDIEALTSIVNDTGIFIVSDEVYEHLIFDNEPHESMIKYPELFERSFVCFSFGKVFHCTGWKLGYCVAPARFMNEFRKVHQFNCFCCDSPKQFALAEYLKNPENYMHLSGEMQHKRDHFIELMKQTKFSLLDSKGSYFICAEYDQISDEPDKEFTIRITKEQGVATIPVSAFYKSGKDDKVVRFCFAKKEETLERAVEKLIHL